MKPLSIYPVLFFISYFAYGQPYKYIYYLDGNLLTCAHSKAVLIGKAYPENGLIKLDCFDKTFGNLMISAHFTDSALGTFQGLFESYYFNSKIEKEGSYLNGVENGPWKKWDYSGNLIDSCVYENGEQMSDARFEYSWNGRLQSYMFTDSLTNKFERITYNEEGIKSSDATFTGQLGIIKQYSGKEKIDSVFTTPTTEASFPGGVYDWIRYLKDNMDPSIALKNGAPHDTYTVIIKFTINEDGSISDVVADTKNGFGTEEEAIRVIKESPNWIPASKNGHPVKTYHKQHFIFVG
jgi:protein TonB